ncbi:MAG: hypothetical protein ACOYU7_07405 [Bacillota bacterium]
MFFRRVTTRRKGKEYVYLKLIETYREGGKVKQRVVANLGNVERLAPEKVQALISGLTKICSPGAAMEYLMDVESKPPGPAVQATEPFRAMWRELGIHTLLGREAETGRVHQSFPWMVEAMVLQYIVNPTETRPINVSCNDLGIDQLKGQDLHGIDYYRAICHLSAMVPAIEMQVRDALNKYLERPAYMCCLPVNAEFIGHECGITTTGTSYQVRPYRKPLKAAIIAHPLGVPVGCRILAGHIGALATELEESFGTPMLIVIRDPEEPFVTPLTRSNYILAVSQDRLAEVPVAEIDPWSGNDVIDNELWIKSVQHNQERYIICHDLRPETFTDQALEEKIGQAARELDKLKAAVKQKRIVRERTVLEKAQEIVKRLGCQDLIEYRFDPNKGTFQYSRREEVIKKEKALRRTQVLKTDRADLPAVDLVKAYTAGVELADELKVVQDLTKIPVIYPYADHQHSEAFIAGQAHIYALGTAIKRLAGLQRR